MGSISTAKKVVLALALAALLAGGAVYASFVLAEPQRAAAHPAPKPKAKVDGAIVMEKQIVVDLAGGRYARVTVGLEVSRKLEEAFAESGVVRDVITRDLTNLEPADLLVRERRDRLKLRLARDIRTQTDEQVGRVLLTDFTIL
jgi:flagellar basal body-associated protein FliL